MKRIKRKDLKSCKGLFHLIEQGNVFLLMWSIKSGLLYSPRRGTQRQAPPEPRAPLTTPLEQ